MAITRTQFVTMLSVVVILLATAIAVYAACRANTLHLPLPDTLTGFATALPILSGLVLKVSYSLTHRAERRKHLSRGETPRPPFVIIANTLIFIYSTVVITLLGTHAGPPSSLTCGLQERWLALYRAKNVEAVRRIQDAFECCGLRNSHDMAWPFPDRAHDQHACEAAFGRSVGCLRSWRSEEQRVAGWLMGVVGIVFVWQMAIIVVPTQRESWLHRVVPERISRIIADEDRDGPRRAIDYLPDFGRYSDRVEEELGNEEEAQSGGRRIRAGENEETREEQPVHAAVHNAWSRE